MLKFRAECVCEICRQLVVFHGAINAQQLPFQDSTCHLDIITCHLDIIIDTNTYAAMLHFL